MRHHGKLKLATLTATVFMVIAVTGTASAQVLSLSNKNLRVAWISLEFNNPTGLGTIRCPLTLEGSFHSQTISKVEKALMGRISRATIAEASCTAGSMSVKRETLPWHITYSGFRGILPRINSVRLLLLGPTFDVRSPFGEICHISATPEHELRGEVILEAGEVTNFIPNEALNIPITNCISTNMRVRGGAADGRITLLGTTTRITISLI